MRRRETAAVSRRSSLCGCRLVFRNAAALVGAEVFDQAKELGIVFEPATVDLAYFVADRGSATITDIVPISYGFRESTEHEGA